MIDSRVSAKFLAYLCLVFMIGGHVEVQARFPWRFLRRYSSMQNEHSQPIKVRMTSSYYDKQ